MSLDADLLEQARHLAARERLKPRQASLRRAISTAYYALFHLLIKEASAMLVPPDLRPLVSRAFNHGEMKQASQAFASATLPQHVISISGNPPPDLRLVARAFVDLQTARHQADYNRERRFTRGQAIRFVNQVDQAFRAWTRMRTQPIAKTYLASLIFWSRWNR